MLRPGTGCSVIYLKENNPNLGVPWGVQWLKLCLPKPGVQVPPLKLRSHVSHCQKKKKKPNMKAILQQIQQILLKWSTSKKKKKSLGLSW